MKTMTKWLFAMMLVAGTALANDAVLSAGLYSSRERSWGGHIALEAGGRLTWATHIRSTDTYKDFIYDEAEDGWYGLPGGYLDLGLSTGLRFQRTTVSLGAGYRDHGAYTWVTPPIYAQLGLSYRWK